MKPGDRAEVAGYQFTLARIDEAGAELRGQARDVRRHAGRRPGRPRDPAEALLSGRAAGDLEAGIDTGLWRDLYVVLGDPVEGARPTAYTVRIYHNPLVMWIWGGVMIMGLPGCCRSAIAATVGAPPRRARAWPRRRPEHKRDGPAPAAVRPAGVIFVGVGIGLAVGLTRDPSTLPSVLIDHPCPSSRCRRCPGATGRASALISRVGQPGQRVRVVVRAVPGRASAPAALAREGVAIYGINYKDPAENAAGWLAELGDPYRASAPTGMAGSRSTGASTACRRPS